MDVLGDDLHCLVMCTRVIIYDLQASRRCWVIVPLGRSSAIVSQLGRRSSMWITSTTKFGFGTREISGHGPWYFAHMLEAVRLLRVESLLAPHELSGSGARTVTAPTAGPLGVDN